MKLKTKRKSLAQVKPHTRKSGVKPLTLGAIYWGKTQNSTDLTFV